jgi:hypothetical protein
LDTNRDTFIGRIIAKQTFPIGAGGLAQSAVAQIERMADCRDELCFLDLVF